MGESGGCGLVMEDEFELDGCEFAESWLSSASMVGPFGPVHDPRGELCAGVPALAVEDVLLEQ